MCCIFCDIKNHIVPVNFLFENENFFVINDANPQTNGHCLIISKNHYEDIHDLPDFLGKELICIIKDQSNRLISEGLADGIKIIQNNGVSAGQTVNHFHVHIIPYLDTH